MNKTKKQTNPITSKEIPTQIWGVNFNKSKKSNLSKKSTFVHGT